MCNLKNGRMSNLFKNILPDLVVKSMLMFCYSSLGNCCLAFLQAVLLVWNFIANNSKYCKYNLQGIVCIFVSNLAGL